MPSISKAHSGLIGEKKKQNKTTLFHRFIVAIVEQVIKFAVNPHFWLMERCFIRSVKICNLLWW